MPVMLVTGVKLTVLMARVTPMMLTLPKMLETLARQVIPEKPVILVKVASGHANLQVHRHNGILVC